MDVFKQLALVTDARALAIARLATEDVLARLEPVAELTPELRDVLREEFGVGTVPPGSVDPATAARLALALMAESDPKTLEGYLAAGVAESLLALVAVATIGLVLLQTEVKIEKSKKGKWSIRIHKRAASDGLLKAYVKAVLGLG